jgi:hypothetical protein
MPDPGYPLIWHESKVSKSIRASSNYCGKLFSSPVLFIATPSTPFAQTTRVPKTTRVPHTLGAGHAAPRDEVFRVVTSSDRSDQAPSL